MAWFYVMVISVRVILSTKAVWEAAKDADVDEKVRTASIIVRKSRVDIEIFCGGGADVLGPFDAVGAGGIEGVKDVVDVGNGAVIAGAADGAIWGSYVSFTGYIDALKPGDPLTTCQPAEYSWMSGYPTPLTKIEQSLFCTGSSTQGTTCPKNQQ